MKITQENYEERLRFENEKLYRQFWFLIKASISFALIILLVLNTKALWYGNLV
jgi:hypothetical protein